MGVVGLWLPNFRCVLHVAQLGCAAASLWEGRLLHFNNFLRAPSIQESTSKQMTLPHVQEMNIYCGYFCYARALMLLMQCVENYPEALWRGTPKLVTSFVTHAVEA